MITLTREALDKLRIVRDQIADPDDPAEFNMLTWFALDPASSVGFLPSCIGARLVAIHHREITDAGDIGRMENAAVAELGVGEHSCAGVLFHIHHWPREYRLLKSQRESAIALLDEIENQGGLWWVDDVKEKEVTQCNCQSRP